MKLFPVRRNKSVATSNKNSKKLTPNLQTTFKKEVSTEKILTVGFALIGLLLLLGSGALWYRQLYSKPERVFWGMIDNNLQTAGVTREILQNTSNGRSVEISQLTFGQVPGVLSTETIEQRGSFGMVSIELEGIGTLNDDFRRYVEINNPSGVENMPLDYSRLYGKWVHANAQQGQTATQPAQLLSKVMLNTVIFGNLPRDVRGEIMQALRDGKVYEVNYDTAKRTSQDGRPTQIFDVSINPRALAGVLRDFGTKIGLKGAESLQPNSYGDQPIAMSVAIDVHSRQLKSLTYKSGNIQERFYSYGVRAPLALPTSSIDLQTFTRTLTEIEGIAPQQ